MSIERVMGERDKYAAAIRKLRDLWYGDAKGSCLAALGDLFRTLPEGLPPQPPRPNLAKTTRDLGQRALVPPQGPGVTERKSIVIDRDADVRWGCSHCKCVIELGEECVIGTRPGCYFCPKCYLELMK